MFRYIKIIIYEVPTDTKIEAAVHEMRPRFPPLPLPTSRQLRNEFTNQ